MRRFSQGNVSPGRTGDMFQKFAEICFGSSICFAETPDSGFRGNRRHACDNRHPEKYPAKLIGEPVFLKESEIVVLINQIRWSPWKKPKGGGNQCH